MSAPGRSEALIPQRVSAKGSPVSLAPRLHVRDVPPRTAFALEQAGVHPLLARLFAARGVRSAEELDDTLGHLLPPTSLHGSAEAARLLADAIDGARRIVVVADYDCDGATACAVALRGLQMLGAPGARLSYVVPDRQRHGYGLTPAIVDLASTAVTYFARTPPSHYEGHTVFATPAH